MRRWPPWILAIALALAGADALPDDPPHVSLVPWKVVDPGDEQVNAPLVLFWIPASRDELRRSDLLTSNELTLFSSRCVAMRVVRGDDYALIDHLGIESVLPVAVLTDSTNRVLKRVEGKSGALSVADVEAMVRNALDERAAAADALLDEASKKADDGETEAAAAIYAAVWEQRCVCPRQGKDAQRALKKLRR